MKRSSTSTLIATYLTGIILILVPFHAFLTIWASTLVGQYTLLRLWSAVLLGLLAAIGIYWLATSPRLRTWFWRDKLVRLVLLYAVITGIAACAGVILQDVAPLAACTGLLLNLRYLAFFLLVWALASRSSVLHRRWLMIVLIPAGIVGLFAVAQYLLLPNDFLKHFGYGPDTIKPFETINSNAAYARFSSTLRGANPLGAYMLVTTTLAVAVWKRQSRSYAFWLSLIGVLSVCGLLISFSRGAWIGTLCSLAIVFAVRFGHNVSKKMLVGVAAGLVVASLALAALSSSNRFLQNALFHTDDASTVAISSNDARETAMVRSIRSVAMNPLGSGVGSAGPASVQNDSPANISENYFLQIAQETGTVGVLIFIAILVALGVRLWKMRTQPLALALFASLIGLVFVNLVSHAWSDDTLAFIWWGLAGLTLGHNYNITHEEAQ